MTFVEHLLEFLVVVTLFGAVVLAVTFFVARSYLRRHWRLLRGHVITRGLVQVCPSWPPAGSAGRPGPRPSS